MNTDTVKGELDAFDTTKLTSSDMTVAGGESAPPTSRTSKKRRGRPLCESQKRRKTVEQFSNNKYSVKSRQYVETMSPSDKVLWNKKRADQGAVNYKMKKVKQSREWQTMSEDERKACRQQVKKDILFKRSAVSRVCAFILLTG